MAFDPGDVWTPELTVRDAAGALTAATVTVSVTSPSGIISAPSVSTNSLGVYTTSITLTEPGDWLATWTVSGAVTGVQPQGVYVRRASEATAWVPSPAEVHSQIPTRPDFTDNSRPSLADVRNIISMIADSLAVEFPVIPPRAYPVAKAYVAYSAAALIETKYDPEQQFGGDNAPASLLDQRAGVELNRLRSITSGTSPSSAAFTITPVGQPGYSTRPLNWWELNLT